MASRTIFATAPSGEYDSQLLFDCEADCIHVCAPTARTLPSVLERLDVKALQPFPDPQPERFVRILNQWFGYDSI